MAKLNCSKTMEFIKADEIMCKHQCTKRQCTKCPVSTFNNGTGMGCAEFMKAHPEKYIEILQNWVDNHFKTYADDFFEKFPNAVKNSRGNPQIKWCLVYVNNGICNKTVTHRAGALCEDCWNEYMEVSR